MLIVSQNLVNYKMQLPKKVILRINLTWVANLNELTKLLNKHKNHDLFLDLPIGRKKPPHNQYSVNELIPLMKLYTNIKFFAISNVESSMNLLQFVKIIPQNIIIIPKIESKKGILNIAEIMKPLKGKRKIVMLDHDDLYSSLLKENNASEFKNYINKLIIHCKKNNIVLLRARGVIFSG